jgi:aminomethyltransferase
MVTASLHPTPVSTLPLHALHVAHGARMEPFAGWTMPIHYAAGVLKEHLHTRSAAGLFDVSHMGQIMVRARSGDPKDAARALEALLPVDVVGLRPGRQRYALLTTDAGGIRDDLMIANLGDFWYLVVNAASAMTDFAYLESHLSPTCTVDTLMDRALLAIQGPEACAVLSKLVPSAAAMRFMDAAVVPFEGAACYISRSGYTGEDGFEISVPRAQAEALAVLLLRHAEVQLIGLGARDSLRLEAGLCLYGHDLDVNVTPIEAALEWAIQPVRRAAGSRSGGFPGSEIILDQLARGATHRRVGLCPTGRPVREGAALFADGLSQVPLGRVTSGTFGPSVQGPIAMGYVPLAQSSTGTRLAADVRGQRIPVTVSDMPFFAHRYHR